MDDSKKADARWGGYVPWFRRFADFSDKGNFEQLFTRLSQRLDRLFRFNEANLPNLLYVCSVLESESLQKFQVKQKGTAADQIRDYFDHRVIMDEAKTKLYGDTAARAVAKLEGKLSLRRLPGGGLDPRVAEGPSNRELESELAIAQVTDQVTTPGRLQAHLNNLYVERLGVLECLLLIIPADSMALTALARDIRRFFVEADLKLDVRGTPPAIVPIEEPALQKGVLEKLFPVLESGFPARARELTKVYHDLIAGDDLDSVFLDAFRTLEQLARDLTGDTSFVFDKSHLSKHFPNLHGTIHDTLIKLAGHRGDEGGHARLAPDPHEIRYLIFATCNAALLLVEYPRDQPRA